MLSFKPCYTISVSLVKRRSEMNAVSFFETLGSTHIKSQNKKPHQDIFTLLREHCHEIIFMKLSWSSFQLKISPWILKSACLGTHSPALSVTCFYLCFSNDLEDWNAGRNVIFLTRRLGRGEEMFPPSGDRERKPKQQHLLYKTRDWQLRNTADSHDLEEVRGPPDTVLPENTNHESLQAQCHVTASKACFLEQNLCSFQVSFVTPVCFSCLPFQLLIR